MEQAAASSSPTAPLDVSYADASPGDTLAKAMSELGISMTNLAHGELQGLNNQLELLQKLNSKTAIEYDDFADFASGLLVFVERLKHKNNGLNEFLHKIDDIEKEVCELEAVVSTLDKYTASLQAKVKTSCTS